MGITDRFFGSSEPDDDPNDETPEGYRVSRMTDKGGWKPVEGYEDLSEPIDQQTFEYNAAPLDPGEYRLFAVVDDMNRQPPEGVGWVLSIEDDTPDRSDQDEVRQEIQRLRDELTEAKNADVDDPQELVEQQKAALQLKALSDERFLTQYGDEVVAGMFGIDGVGGSDSGDSPGFEDFKENPMAAAGFTAFQAASEDPHKLEQLGAGIGSLFSGVASGAAGGSSGITDAAADDPQPDEQPADDQDDSPTANVSGGASSPSDLAGAADEGPTVDDEQLKQTVATAGQQPAHREPAGKPDDADDSETVVRREGPGTTGDGSDDDHITDDLVDVEGGPAEPPADPEDFGSEFEADESTNGHDEDADVTDTDDTMTNDTTTDDDTEPAARTADEIAEAL